MTEKANIVLCYDERNKPSFTISLIVTAADVPGIDVLIVFLLRLSFALSMEDDFAGVLYS